MGIDSPSHFQESPERISNHLVFLIKHTVSLWLESPVHKLFRS